MRRSKRDVTHKYSTKALGSGALQPEEDVGVVPVEAHPGGSTTSAEGGKAAEGGPVDKKKASSSTDDAEVGKVDNSKAASSTYHPLHLQSQQDAQESTSNWVSQYIDCPACLIPLREALI